MIFHKRQHLKATNGSNLLKKCLGFNGLINLVESWLLELFFDFLREPNVIEIMAWRARYWLFILVILMELF